MSLLRRRLGKDSKAESPTIDVSGGATPGVEEAAAKGQDVSLRSGSNVKNYVAKPRSKRRNGFIFFLGGIFGIFVALFFANHNEVISLDSLMDLNLDALVDVIPQGIVKDFRELSVRLTSFLPFVYTCVFWSYTYGSSGL